MRMKWNSILSVFTLAGTCLLALLINPTIDVGAAATSATEASTEGTLLADLVAFEEHVGQITDRVIGATVAITLGRNEGTGVIVSPDGYIVTVGHVFLDDKRIRARVILSDGRRVWADALGCNYTRDYGLLKLDGDGPWPYVEMGTSADLEVNDPCFAVGHTGGHDRQRTASLRWGQIQSTQGRFLQSDCAINKGDSGGPLFDFDGRVIGIHSRIYPPLDENYHVPIDACRDSWDRLIDPEIQRWTESRSWRGSGFRGNGAFMGVNLRDKDGCFVDGVTPNFPAEKAGIKAGDFIIEMDDRTITNRLDLTRTLSRKRPGDVISVIVLRGQEQLTLELKLARRPN